MLHIRQPSTALIGALLVLLSLAGCGGSGSDSSSSSSFALSGTPSGSANPGIDYSFQPTVSQGTEQVTFSISGLPTWASFNSTTGALSGTPGTKDVGKTWTVTITASSASGTAAIGPFSIQVAAAGSGASVTLNWEPPSENTNGSEASQLIGYYIYYGTNPDELTQWVIAWGAQTSSFAVENLAPGTYYFSVRAYNWLGIESAPSATVSTNI
jgi:Putative Ig domain